MPRYVILEHDHPGLHWDLMLEAEAVLRTWRLDRPPESQCIVPAAASADHRRHYLDYQGPVGGDRGHVRRWDHGTFAWEEDQPGRVIVRVEGARLQGELRLEKVNEEWAVSLRPGRGG